MRSNLVVSSMMQEILYLGPELRFKRQFSSATFRMQIEE
jgi:hypothetical protein